MTTLTKTLTLLSFLALAACGTSERPEANSRNGSSTLSSLTTDIDDSNFDEQAFNDQFDSEFGDGSVPVEGDLNSEQALSGYEAYRDLIQFTAVLPTSVNRTVGSATTLLVNFTADPTVETGFRWFFNGNPLASTTTAIGVDSTSEADEGLYTIEVFVIESDGTEVPIYRGSCAVYVFP